MPGATPTVETYYTPRTTTPWHVEHVQAGRLQTIADGEKNWTTAIFKESLEGPVYLDQFGIVGDEHTGDHADLDRAICVHPSAHYTFWQAYFQRELRYGFFGENLTVSGLLDEDVCIGDIIRCGTCLLQVTMPRTPCYKQARRLGVPTFVKLILQTGKLGFLLRVLEPGYLNPHDQFELVERPHPAMNLVYVNRIRHERDAQTPARQLAALPELGQEWRTVLLGAEESTAQLRS